MKLNELILRDGLLYTKERVMAIDMFDMLKCRPLESLLSPLDIEYLHKIATSLRYSGRYLYFSLASSTLLYML